MWEYNHTPSSDELYHYGVPGMKWGQRRAAKNLNKKLVKAFKALDAKEKSSTIQSIKSPVDGSIHQFRISNTKKTKAYDKAAKAVNGYMDKLNKKGYDWRYDSNYGLNGKLTTKGKGYVETFVNGQKIRKEF